MSANSLDGYLEVGKGTWREGVKLRFERLEINKYIYIYMKRIEMLIINGSISTEICTNIIYSWPQQLAFWEIR